MFSKIKSKFKKSPHIYYAMSIAATWANAGSLLNGIGTAQKNGIIPFLLWALGNTLACIVFGIAAPRIPKLRDVFRSRLMKIVMGLMCPFQCWISMNGIQTVFSDTVIGPKIGVMVALAFAFGFIILLWKSGMIRNILTDYASWTAVYGIVFALALIPVIRGKTISLAMGVTDIHVGIKNCLLLIPGAFLYPYYYEILDYNDKNGDGTESINVKSAFITGGCLFGVYLVFIFIMAFAEFSPAVKIVEAVLVTLIAASSLSSFLYSIYLTFGRKLGLILNVATAFLWQLLIPLGVMGAWTLMASIRIYIVAGAIITALLWNSIEKRKAVST